MLSALDWDSIALGESLNYLEQEDGIVKILVADPATSSLSDLSAVLTAKGHDVRLASRSHQAEQQLSTFHPDVTILNPAVGDMDAKALINRFKEQVPGADIIL